MDDEHWRRLRFPTSTSSLVPHISLNELSSFSVFQGARRFDDKRNLLRHVPLVPPARRAGTVSALGETPTKNQKPTDIENTVSTTLSSSQRLC